SGEGSASSNCATLQVPWPSEQAALSFEIARSHAPLHAVMPFPISNLLLGCRVKTLQRIHDLMRRSGPNQIVSWSARLFLSAKRSCDRETECSPRPCYLKLLIRTTSEPS